MWKHAASQGRYGDAAAYYSSLGGIWDVAWLVVTLLFARKALSRDYWANVVRPADPLVWAWLQSRMRLSETAAVLLYRGMFFYGLGRMITWFIYARFEARPPWEPIWGDPRYVVGNDISDAGLTEVLLRTAIGGGLFALFVGVCWRLFGARLWARGMAGAALLNERELKAALGNPGPAVTGTRADRR